MAARDPAIEDTRPREAAEKEATVTVIRRAIHAGVFFGAALTILVFATAIQAASGFRLHDRPFPTDATARGQAIQLAEHLQLAPETRAARGQVKLDARLAELARRPQSQRAQRFIRSDASLTRDDKARVVVETRRPVALRAIVKNMGGRVERTSAGLVQVVIAASALPGLSQRPEVDFVRAPLARVEHAVSGEEIAASLASPWHEKGFTGKGVKVAIIDGGFLGLPERQAAGELPSNVITSDFCGGRFGTASEHGTAVAEIVHEMAPEAQLYLLCIDTEVDLAAAVSYAKSQGVQIVNHSMGWYGPARGDGTGYVGSIVADARASGILWVNSAGNDAQTHWSGAYTPGGDSTHDWSTGDEGNTFLWPNGEEVCGFLKWDEWPAAVSDFDLALVSSATNTLIAASAEAQDGGQPPFEGLCIEQRTGADIYAYWAIVGYRVSTAPRFDLFAFSPPLQYQTAAGSIPDPATSSAAMAVGAVCWQTKQLEFYSSQGPTIDGRTKPDIAGHDSVSGSTYGMSTDNCPSGFAGTSAASPEVAGAAALVRQAYPGWGPEQLQQFLQKSALDIALPGPDNTTGAGELRLPKPPDVVAPSAQALAGVGHRGKMMKLLSRVSDDSGQVGIVEQVKRNGAVVATMKKGRVAASNPTEVAAVWKVPVNATGAHQHCVRAIDPAGNASPVHCAKVVLK
jgi:subtilisin family serine protease